MRAITCLHVQGSGEVLTMHAVLRGRPGLVTVHARDAAEALTSEHLELRLAPGPMAGLAFGEPGSRNYGTRALIPALTVTAVDDFGNRTACAAAIEVPMLCCWLHATHVHTCRA